MGRIIAVLILLIGVIISFMFFPDLMSSTHDVLTDQQTTTGNITTGVGETTGTVWLARGVYNDDYNNVVSLTSTSGSDSPYATAFAPLTNYLTVSGLAASTNRVLTVIYEYEATADYTGMTTTVELAPTLLVLGILMVVFGGLYFGVRHAIGSRG